MKAKRLTPKAYARKPGSRWRVLSHSKGEPVHYGNVGTFDEFVCDHWLHIEQMDTRIWWAQIGDARIGVHIRTDGSVEVNIERGEYGPVDGWTIPREPEVPRRTRRQK